jgi:predicted nucleotidyltransferase
MSALDRALNEFLQLVPSHVQFALVGGIAVAARTEPRFTRDLDFAISVDSEHEAETTVSEFRQLGYAIQTVLENTAKQRLSTVRLRRSPRSPIIDLLFAASGIEPEAVAGAERIELGSGVIAPVARIGHLIAMKLVSRDAKRRPNDQQDLVNLAKVADELEWSLAESSIDLIRVRGYHRGRNLHAGLAELRTIWHAQ